MAHLARSSATLRIVGDDLIPNEISSMLGAQPSLAQYKGQELPGKSGVRVAKFGMWRLSAIDAEPEDLDGRVVQILDSLTKDLQVWKDLASRFEIDLFCGCFMDQSNEGISVSSTTIEALGKRGIELSLDIYAPSASA